MLGVLNLVLWEQIIMLRCKIGHKFCKIVFTECKNLVLTVIYVFDYLCLFS